MTCAKCNYQDKNEKKIFNIPFCSICAKFAPQEKAKFNQYLNEKIDWKIIDTFRKFNQQLSLNQKQAMNKKAKQGKLVTRAPLGYDVVDGKLQPNQQASKLHSLFKIFLEKNHSLNNMAKNNNLSVNGLKKILTNRTYLSEIKFAGNLYKGTHQPLIEPEIFYAVQRKLKTKLKPKS